MSPYMSSTGWMSTYMLKKPNKSQVISSLLGHGVELCCAQRGEGEDILLNVAVVLLYDSLVAGTAYSM